jgi:hypothetical protein
MPTWMWNVRGSRMNPTQAATLKVFTSLQPGDRVELKHEVKVGFRSWQTTTIGTVVGAERRRHGLHHRRNFDDKVFSDILVLRRDDGELTTVTLDEFSVLKKLPAAPVSTESAQDAMRPSAS